jgi:dethiobiotin synthetase
LRGLFITGTDTGVGKTVVAAAIVAALRARGTRVAPLKPVLTGLAERADPEWPADHELLAQAAGCAPAEVIAVGYDPPVSPHLAAQLTQQPIEPGALLAHVERAAEGVDVVIVEGVGGLLVPLAPGYEVRALARDLALPIVIAARPGLGTISHTLLTIEAARAAHLVIAGVVLTPWPERPSEIERSNLETIPQLGEVQVATLPRIARPTPELLAAAGSTLSLERWLAVEASLP